MHGAYSKIIVLFVGAFFLGSLAGSMVPDKTLAAPFGGAAGQVIFCFNDVIWTAVGPPRGGDYIWVPGTTRTYNYGPPSHSGQWLLGLYAPPYFCIVTPNPLVVFSGIIMTMLGSSQ